MKKAVELLEHVVVVNIRVHAANRLASQRNLAIAYQVDRQVKKAVELLEQVVAVCTRNRISSGRTDQKGRGSTSQTPPLPNASPLCSV